jgi:aspartokinase
MESNDLPSFRAVVVDVEGIYTTKPREYSRKIK